MSPLRLEASPFFSKDDNLSKFLNRRKNPIKSLSCENFDLLLYRDFKLFEQKLLLVKNQCNSELEFLLYELTNFCMQKEQKDLQIVYFKFYYFFLKKGMFLIAYIREGFL